jgi:hypothetical protein
MGNDDTIQLRTLQDTSATPTFVLLKRIRIDIGLLADVLSKYPDRHREVWHSADWAKDLTDLELACASLRRSACQLEELIERIGRGELPRAY